MIYSRLNIKNMRYPPKSYQRLYNSSVFGQQPKVCHRMGVTIARVGFFEWRYFEAAFDNGYVLVAIFHSPLYNAADHKPTLDLRVYIPQDKRIFGIRRYNRERFTSRRDRCELQLGNCRVNSDSPHYQLALRECDIEADLTFTPQLPGWQPGDDYLFYDEASKHFLNGLYLILAAIVTGSLGWVRPEF